MRARATGRTIGWTVSVAALVAGLSLSGVAALVAPLDGAGAAGDLAFGPDRPLGQPARNPSSPFLRTGPDGRVYAVWTEDDPTPGPRPRPAADPSRRGHWMITFDMRVVLLASSGDGGATWTAPRRVNSVTEAAQGEENEPKVAFAPDGRALVAWSIPSERGTRAERTCGSRWRTGGRVHVQPDWNEVPNAARFPLLEPTPDNAFLLAWIDRRVDNPTPRALYVRRISGSGQELGRSYEVGEDACDCCRLGVAFADQGRTVYLVHREVGKEQVRNHVLRKSTDGGLTFGAPVTISDDGWQTGCPHSGPAIAVDRRGQLHVTWFTLGRAPGEAGVYYSVSRDGGQTFAPASSSTPIPLPRSSTRRSRWMETAPCTWPGTISTSAAACRSSSGASPPTARRGPRRSGSAPPGRMRGGRPWPSPIRPCTLPGPRRREKLPGSCCGAPP